MPSGRLREDVCTQLRTELTSSRGPCFLLPMDVLKADDDKPAVIPNPSVRLQQRSTIRLVTAVSKHWWGTGIQASQPFEFSLEPLLDEEHILDRLSVVREGHQGAASICSLLRICQAATEALVLSRPPPQQCRQTCFALHGLLRNNTPFQLAISVLDARHTTHYYFFSQF